MADLYDTAEMRAIVEEVIEKALDNKLRDRPTRAEVETMIGTRVSAAIHQMEARMKDDRREHMANLEKLLDQKIGQIRDAFSAFATTHESQRQDTRRRIDDLERGHQRQETTLTLLTGTVNQHTRDLYGSGEADGPDSLFKMVREMRGDVAALQLQFAPRIEALEAAEAARQAFMARLFKAGAFLTSRRGLLLIVFITTVLLGLLDRGYVVEQYLAPFLGALGGQP